MSVAWAQRLTEEINVADVIGQDAYRRAVALSRRRAGLSQREIAVGTTDVHLQAAALYGNGSHAAAAAQQEDGLVKGTPSEP